MYESIYKHPFRNILLRTKRVRNLICYLSARNLEKGEVSRDFNLHDHPILPVNSIEHTTIAKPIFLVN